MEIELLSQKTISRARLEMTGKIDRLMADAFLQAAIAGDHIGVMVDEVAADSGRRACVRPAPCRRPSRCLAPEDPSSSRCPAHGRTPDGPPCGCRVGESFSAARSACPHSRADSAARIAASSHGRRRARSGRGRASPDFDGSMLMKRLNRTVATSAMPIGMPGWPELAFCTASMASARMALAMSASETAASGFSVLRPGSCVPPEVALAGADETADRRADPAGLVLCDRRAEPLH